MSERKERKPYERPAVVFERELEALAADCGTGIGNPFLGDNNCKGEGDCAILYS
jgi:hypothetical protein